MPDGIVRQPMHGPTSCVLPLRLAKETAAEFGQMGSPSHSILLLETVVPRADADQEVDKAGDAS